MSALSRLGQAAGYARYLFDPRVYLGLVERLALLLPWRSDQPQLFILGLPRSGTTLVYQVITHRLPVAYFTHGVGRYHLSPCLVTFAQRRRHGDYRSDFTSRYGRSEGPVSPREAGSFWARFFGYEEYVRFEEVAPGKVRLLRKTIACAQRIYGNAPFVNKNVKHLLRIDALAQIFPAAIFLVVERDLKDVALSVLKARHEYLGDAVVDRAAGWWSVRPPNYAELVDLPPVEQVAGQVVALQARLEDDLRALPPERVMRLNYAAFCQEPELLIEALRERWGPIPDRNPPLDHFPLSVQTPQTDEQRRLIEVLAYVARG